MTTPESAEVLITTILPIRSKIFVSWNIYKQEEYLSLNPSANKLTEFWREATQRNVVNEYRKYQCLHSHGEFCLKFHNLTVSHENNKIVSTYVKVIIMPDNWVKRVSNLSKKWHVLKVYPSIYFWQLNQIDFISHNNYQNLSHLRKDYKLLLIEL